MFHSSAEGQKIIELEELELCGIYFVLYIFYLEKCFLDEVFFSMKMYLIYGN